MSFCHVPAELTFFKYKRNIAVKHTPLIFVISATFCGSTNRHRTLLCKKFKKNFSTFTICISNKNAFKNVVNNNNCGHRALNGNTICEESSMGRPERGSVLTLCYVNWLPCWWDKNNYRLLWHLSLTLWQLSLGCNSCYSVVLTASLFVISSSRDGAHRKTYRQQAGATT